MATNSSNVIQFTPAGEVDETRTATGGATTRGRSSTASEASFAVGLHPRFDNSSTVTLQQLSKGIVLIHPLYVRLERMGDEWLATSMDLALVGRGDSDFEALDDLRDLIGEFYSDLIEDRDRLGPDLLSQLNLLERLAGKR